MTRDDVTVLITCCGKRYDIVSAFRQHAHVVACDGNGLAPALYAADERCLIPPIADKAYVPTLLELCREHGVQAVVPLTDLDLEILATAKDQFEIAGATVFAPDVEVVRCTHDKYLAHQLFTKLELPSPPTHLPEEVPEDMRYPVLVKPRGGSGARGIMKAHDPAELEFFVGYAEEPVMVQSFMNGDEFSVDILCDLEGRCLGAIPRTMLESRGGESIKGATLRDDELIELGRAVGERLPCRGPATVQCFRDPELGLGLTDVNCRFGGAFPAPMYAGGRYPELIVRMAAGEQVEPAVGDFEDGVWFTRYFWHLELAERDGAFTPTGRDFIPGGPPVPESD